MSVVTSCRIYKIKSENETHSEGRVLKVKSAGVSNFGVGRVSRNPASVFKVSLSIDGVKKPIDIKVKASDGASGTAPLDEGDTVNVVYDRLKPKRCNIDDKAQE